MRELKLICAVIGAIVVVCVGAVLFPFFRADERAEDLYPYDDDDPGVDVDEVSLDDESCCECGWPIDSVLPCLCTDNTVEHGGEA